MKILIDIPNESLPKNYRFDEANIRELIFTNAREHLLWQYARALSSTMTVTDDFILEHIFDSIIINLELINLMENNTDIELHTDAFSDRDFD
jgi:hypothetical protein